jgi:hypothetical protein
MQEKRTVAQVIEHVFTHDNPTTGSTPPEHMAWVVFANGTVFFSAPNDMLTLDASAEAVAAAAREALRELGPVIPGTPAGDFNAAHLGGWFPGEHVYFVTYDHPAVATVVLADAQNDLAAGLEGRARRAADSEAMEVELIRTFDGEVTR